MSDRIASVTPGKLEGEANPNFKYTKKCVYCSEQMTLTNSEWKEHASTCEETYLKRFEERKLSAVEQEMREIIANVEDLPLAQGTAFKGEQLIPWQQDSFIGIVIQNHMTRTQSNIILPANMDDLTPELRDCLAVANVCRVIKVSDSFARDKMGCFLWPRLAEVKDQIENQGLLGPLVKFMPGSAKPFPDSDGRACVLVQCRYVYGEIEGSQKNELDGSAAEQIDMFSEKPDVEIRRGITT